MCSRYRKIRRLYNLIKLQRHWCIYFINSIDFQEAGRAIQPRGDVAPCPPRDGRPDNPLRLGAPFGGVLSLLICRCQGLREIPSTAAARQSRAIVERFTIHHQAPEPSVYAEEYQDPLGGVRAPFKPCMLLWGMI